MKIYIATANLQGVLSSTLIRQVVRQNKYLQAKAIEEGEFKLGGSSATRDTITARQPCSSHNSWFKKTHHTRDKISLSYRTTTIHPELKHLIWKRKRTKNCWLTSRWAQLANLRVVYKQKILPFRIKTNCSDFQTTSPFNNPYEWHPKLTRDILRALLVRSTPFNPICYIPNPTLLCNTSVLIPVSSPTLL